MASSVVIPQDIIHSIIAVVDDDDDHRLLKTCAVVSSSFLLPSRKRLFSSISLRNVQASQRLHQVLVKNPIVQSFVKSIVINSGWHREATPLSESILQLPFCCLKNFSMSNLYWNSFSSGLKDALSKIIHSPSLETLYFSDLHNMPIELFQGIHLKQLTLRSISPLFDGALPASDANTASNTVVDWCAWNFCYPVPSTSFFFPTPSYFSLILDIESLPKPIFLPFMSHPRVVEIDASPYSTTIRDMNILSFMIRTLGVSLASPATLEHLKFSIEIESDDDHFNGNAIFDDLRYADVWKHLDSFSTHPSCSRLQRVDIEIKFEDNLVGYDETKVVKPILDALPLLGRRGILFVKSTTYEMVVSLPEANTPPDVVSRRRWYPLFDAVLRYLLLFYRVVKSIFTWTFRVFLSCSIYRGQFRTEPQLLFPNQLMYVTLFLAIILYLYYYLARCI